MTAKDDAGEYLVATSFGKRRRIRRDRQIARPGSVVELVFQIEQCYAENSWDAGEECINHRLLGLGAKPLADLTDGELEIVRADLEKRRMILYEE